MTVIDSFKGEYSFLSNFYPSPIVLPHWHAAAGMTAPTMEHAFQSAKTEGVDAARNILTAPSPGASKQMGRRVILRPGWDESRDQIMLGLLRIKFDPGSDLSVALLETRYVQIVEGNTWGDVYWGQVNGSGANMLGRLLMLVRAELDVWLASVQGAELATT